MSHINPHRTESDDRFWIVVYAPWRVARSNGRIFGRGRSPSDRPQGRDSSHLPERRGDPGPADRWDFVATAASVVVVAVAVRLSAVLQGGGLKGVLSYDDGVYFSATLALVSGRLPYEDYLLLHPPGVLVALAPFAELGRLTTDSTGLAAARLACMGLGALNAVLVMCVVRHHGRLATAAGGLFYAVWQPAVITEGLPRLEVFVNTGVLVALALLSRRTAPSSPRTQVAAGLAAGFAVAVKIWAVAPVAVLVLWQGLRHGPRVASHVVAGAAASATALCLPFLLAAPGDMIRMVVRAQLGRGHNGGGPAERWAKILTVQHLAGSDRPRLALLVVAFLTLVVLLLAVSAARQPGGDVAVALLVVQTLVLLRSPSFFPFYAAFVAPALAVTVAVGVARAWGWLSDRLPRVQEPLRAAAVFSGTATLVTLGLVAATLPTGRPFPAARLRPGVQDSRCVTADSPVALVLLDVLSRNLDRGCPLVVDVTGLTYDSAAMPLRPDGTAVPRPLNRRWQRTLLTYLTSGDATLIVRPQADGLAPDSRLLVSRLPVRARHGDFVVRGTSLPPQGLRPETTP